MGRLSKTAKGIWAAFVLLVAAPVVGRYFEGIAEEYGLYQSPTSNLLAMLSALASVTDWPWFWHFCWGLAGIGIGLGVDSVLRGIDARSGAENNQEARVRPFPTPSKPSALPTENAPLFDPKRMEGLGRIEASHRDDHDMVPVRFVVRGRMTDDGYDISALIQYRNRSDRYLMLKPLTAEFEIAEKPPVGQLTDGVSADLPKQTSHQISFKPVRVYNARPVQGKARFAFRYGERNGPMRTILDMSYSFVVKSFPPDKSTDAVLDVDLAKSERYFVGAPLDKTASAI